MTRGERRRTAAIFMPLLFVLSSWIAVVSPPPDQTPSFLDDEYTSETSLNVETTLYITSAGGTSSALKAEVPDNHAVELIDISVKPSAIPYSDAATWDDASGWNASGAILDQVNINMTDGLQLQPKIWDWDFEYPSTAAFQASGWTMGTGWLWGYDSCLGQSGGVHGGTKAIYTYNCNYPNYIPSSGYFATSPVIDCSGCTGTWYLKYWKRLGIEYYYYDDAQVHVKNRQGSWVVVWDHSGSSTNPSSWSLMTHDISSYVNNNPNFQIRFKLGRTDGSVTYTGWNVDDITIEPAAGAGGGDFGNWTSARFGPSVTGAYGSEGDHYGLVSIDADVPQDSSLRVSVLDGVSKTVLPGWYNQDVRWLDLAAINAEQHPSLRIKLHLSGGSSGTPVVKSVNFNGRYKTSFSDDPTNDGWTLNNMDFDGNSVIGSGNAVSPLFELRRPTARLAVNAQVNGNWGMDVALDGGDWQSMATSGTHNLDMFAHTLQFRVAANGGNIDLLSLQIDLQGGFLPVGPHFDISDDGWAEWSLENPLISQWGWQDRLMSGGLSHDFTWSAPGTKQVGILLPGEGLEMLRFELTPYAATDTLNVSMQVGGSGDLFSFPVTLLSTTTMVELNVEQLEILNENLSMSTPYWTQPGGISYSVATFNLNTNTGQVRLGGVAAVHRPQANLSFSSGSFFVTSLNSELPTAPLIASARLVPLTASATQPGALKAIITRLESSANAISLPPTILNGTSQPLTPSWQWLELESNHTYGEGIPAYVSMHVEGETERISYRFPVDGSSPIQIVSYPGQIFSGEEEVLFPTTGWSTMELSEGHVNSTIRFRLNASWDDQQNMEISVNLVMLDSTESAPRTLFYGFGSTYQGFEDDIQLVDWRVINELGETIPMTASYLRSSSPIQIEVNLGFENVPVDYLNPRSGDVRVHLLQNGHEVGNTTSLYHGTATFDLSTPQGTGDVEYLIEVEPLLGQDFFASMAMNRTFTVDSLSPSVIDTNFELYDHRTQSPNQFVRIEVYDRPVLPTTLDLMVWREWLDDTDFDGRINPSEFVEMELAAPSNLSMARGNYTAVIDDTGGEMGDIVAVYVSGADAAGNLIVAGGSSDVDAQLFTYQLQVDGPPLLTGVGGFTDAPDGRYNWLHPGIEYEFALSVNESNGWYDIDHLEMQLASNSVMDTLSVTWTADTGRCQTTSINLYIQRCGIRAHTGELTPFNPDLEFYTEFSLNWTLLQEGDLRREPSLQVTDRSGQGAWLSLPQLRWRYSPDLMIDTEAVNLDVGEGVYSSEGAWVAPSSTLSLIGDVVFSPTGVYPHQSFSVRVLLDGAEIMAPSVEGLWSAQLIAPEVAGSYPLTFELADLPAQARDLTNTDLALRWIVVDPDGPEVVEVLAPRPGSQLPILSLEELVVEVRLKELEQINPDSLILHWKVIRGADVLATPLVKGEGEMTIPGGNLAGQSITASVTLDIYSLIPGVFYSDDLRLHIWITGSDMAGNRIKTPTGTNTAENPFASWSIERLEPDFSVDTVTYSREGEVSVGDTVMVTISVRNDGEAFGTAFLMVYEVHLDDSRRTLTAVPIMVDVNAGERVLYNIDWVPDEPGRQWIIVEMGEQEAAMGSILHVVEADEPSLLESVFSGVNTIWVLMFIGLVVLLGAVVLIAMRSGGTREYSYDDTDDYWESSSDSVLEAATEIEEAPQEPVIHGQPADVGAPAPEVLAPMPEPGKGMSDEHAQWLEQARQWGGYYDEAGTWVALE